MRYTFNMVTMMKEKVNTHFSFPLRLDMTPYTEDFLMAKGDRKEGTLHPHHRTLSRTQSLNQKLDELRTDEAAELETPFRKRLLHVLFIYFTQIGCRPYPCVWLVTIETISLGA